MSQPGPAPPQPSFAQIPLPPGFTLDQYLTLQGQIGELSFFCQKVVRIIDEGAFSFSHSDHCNHRCRWFWSDSMGLVGVLWLLSLLEIDGVVTIVV